MNDFWITFAPNAAATLVGVVVGVPVALWLNRLRTSAAARQEESAGRIRLRFGLETVLAALEHNQDSLEAIATRIGQDRMPFDSALDAGAWEAARDEIVPFLRQPELNRRMAFHFARLESLRRLTAIYLDLFIGRIGDPKKINHDLRAFLLREVKELRDDSRSLAIELRATARN